MIRWCKIKKRTDEAVVWEGKVVGYGKPQITVTVTPEQDNKLPKPCFKNKVILRKDCK